MNPRGPAHDPNRHGQLERTGQIAGCIRTPGGEAGIVPQRAA